MAVYGFCLAMMATDLDCSSGFLSLIFPEGNQTTIFVGVGRAIIVETSVMKASKPVFIFNTGIFGRLMCTVEAHFTMHDGFY